MYIIKEVFIQGSNVIDEPSSYEELDEIRSIMSISDGEVDTTGNFEFNLSDFDKYESDSWYNDFDCGDISFDDSETDLFVSSSPTSTGKNQYINMVSSEDSDFAMNIEVFSDTDTQDKIKVEIDIEYYPEEESSDEGMGFSLFGDSSSSEYHEDKNEMNFRPESNINQIGLLNEFNQEILSVLESDVVQFLESDDEDMGYSDEELGFSLFGDSSSSEYYGDIKETSFRPESGVNQMINDLQNKEEMLDIPILEKDKMDLKEEELLFDGDAVSSKYENKSTAPIPKIPAQTRKRKAKRKSTTYHAELIEDPIFPSTELERSISGGKTDDSVFGLIAEESIGHMSKIHIDGLSYQIQDSPEELNINMEVISEPMGSVAMLKEAALDAKHFLSDLKVGQDISRTALREDSTWAPTSLKDVTTEIQDISNFNEPLRQSSFGDHSNIESEGNRYIGDLRGESLYDNEVLDIPIIEDSISELAQSTIPTIGFNSLPVENSQESKRFLDRLPIFGKRKSKMKIPGKIHRESSSIDNAFDSPAKSMSTRSTTDKELEELDRKLSMILETSKYIGNELQTSMELQSEDLKYPISASKMIRTRTLPWMIIGILVLLHLFFLPQYFFLSLTSICFILLFIFFNREDTSTYYIPVSLPETRTLHYTKPLEKKYGNYDHEITRNIIQSNEQIIDMLNAPWYENEDVSSVHVPNIKTKDESVTYKSSRLAFSYIGMNNYEVIRNVSVSKISSPGNTDIDTYFQYLYNGEYKYANQSLSSVIEHEYEDPRLYRKIAFYYEQHGLYEDAISLYKKVQDMRPEEPQSHRDLALALSLLKEDYREMEVLNILNIVLSRTWDQHFHQIEATVLHDISGIAQKMDPLNLIHAPDIVDIIMVNPLNVDIRIVLTWDTDRTDIELIVVEPNGEKCSCYYNHTTNGGYMSKDMTAGYGPIEYLCKSAPEGDFFVIIKNNTPNERFSTRVTTAKICVYNNFGKSEQKTYIVCKDIEPQNVGEDIPMVKINFGPIEM
eukprot:TRINITY_DN3173_c0_g1_i2.p1 TRINITY_DN3173_c0_g1~~TRINITY_DN3173_c0_g1_i2.p1  ORF type:complete len:1012 (+),score=241.34 TRINITY_DN3173_c0_g1_i2:2129-5164(+)